MIDSPYQREDIGFTFTVLPLGEIATDPGFRPGEWFVKHTDQAGMFIIPLEDELKLFAGDDPLWEQPTKAVFNREENVVLLLKIGEIEFEQAIMTLLHRSAAELYIAVDSK